MCVIPARDETAYLSRQKLLVWHALSICYGHPVPHHCGISGALAHQQQVATL